MRIIALSDQHGFLPEIPPCDLLIIAGDVCPDRIGPFLAQDAPRVQLEWFDRQARPWLVEAPATHVVLTWGNHDFCGDRARTHAADFSADAPRRSRFGGLQIAVDQLVEVPRCDDPRVARLAIWMSPWSNRFMDWAFMREPEELARVYAEIPEGIDILVSHQPPYGYGDHGLGPDGREHMGSRELLATIDRVRPKAVICGHFHAGYGVYEHNGTTIYNVAVVDEQYRLVNKPTIIDWNQ